MRESLACEVRAAPTRGTADVYPQLRLRFETSTGATMIRFRTLVSKHVALASLTFVAACGSAPADDAASTDLPTTETNTIEPQRYRAWRQWRAGGSTSATTAPTTTSDAPPAPAGRRQLHSPINDN